MDWLIAGGVPFLIFLAFGLSLLISELKGRARARERDRQYELKHYPDRLAQMCSTKGILKGHEYRWLLAHWKYATCDTDELIIQSLPDYSGEIIRP